MAQLSTMNKKLKVLAVGTQTACGLCGGPYENYNCSFIQDDQSSTKQVNYLGNQPRPPQNDPYSNTFNPCWRNHPNFDWGGNQRQWNNNNFQNNHQPQPPFQRKPPFPPEPKPPHPNSIEAALEKLTLSIASFIQSTNNFMQSTNNFFEETNKGEF
ncbi:hypothetical protein PIB30_108010 [Stylosanthes scabra]|uniref:Uncharacterized protein n=1 Tax=Stylosanthes scabra TaxID=79078 RepID=A0ABU6RZK6_9FABA|nr:hypothetical protein [Stylosanthes scabra]